MFQDYIGASLDGGGRQVFGQFKIATIFEKENIIKPLVPAV